MYDFLFGCHCKYSSIVYHFRYILRGRMSRGCSSCEFPYDLCIAEIYRPVKTVKTASFYEHLSEVTYVVVPACDERTDGQRDRRRRLAFTL